MIDPTEILTGLDEELKRALTDLRKAKPVDERLKHSEVVKNLSQSLGEFLRFMALMAENEGNNYDFAIDDFDDEEIDDDDDKPF
jgi:hypothetical protein